MYRANVSRSAIPGTIIFEHTLYVEYEPQNMKIDTDNTSMYRILFLTLNIEYDILL